MYTSTTSVVSRGPRSGLPRAAVVGLLLAGLSSAAVIGAEGAAAAVVPTFPDNLLVFPNRDFITVEGYQDHAGEVATVTVTRPLAGPGRRLGTGQGSPAGMLAFEINPPRRGLLGSGHEPEGHPGHPARGRGGHQLQRGAAGR